MAADAMETLAGRYTRRAVRSVFIYTREAHPGENYRQHTSMDSLYAPHPPMTSGRAFQATSTKPKRNPAS